MRILPLILLTPAGMLGCQRDRVDQEPFEQTPAGHLVRWQDEGTLDQGVHTKADLYGAFDQAVDRSANYLSTKYGADPDQIRAIARGGAFTLVDNRRFWLDSLNYTGWAAGCNSGQGSIMVAYWGTKTGAALPFDLPCPWTAALNPANQLWYWGIERRPYPALDHELGHSIFGPTFEHPELGWRWPQ